MTKSADSDRSPENRAALAFKPVIAALQAERAQEAVRAFLQILPTGVVPSDGQMMPWLAHMTGRPLLIKLINAFIQFPCFYCDAGRVQCEHCQGKGDSSEANRPCHHCLGMGHERCGFCAGSGWISISDVPDGFRRPVIKGRATLAAARTQSLLRQQLPDPSSSDYLQVIRRLRTVILELDRQMGVFENMLIAARHLPPIDAPGEDSTDRVIQKCVLLAGKAEIRICEVIHLIAAAYRLASQTAGAGAKAQDHESAAKFYDSLVDPDRTLTGTGLEHPFLHEAVRQLAAPKS